MKYYEHIFTYKISQETPAAPLISAKGKIKHTGYVVVTIDAPSPSFNKDSFIGSFFVNYTVDGTSMPTCDLTTRAKPRTIWLSSTANVCSQKKEPIFIAYIHSYDYLCVHVQVSVPLSSEGLNSFLENRNYVVADIRKTRMVCEYFLLLIYYQTLCCSCC
jgi:hypothetical protein